MKKNIILVSDKSQELKDLLNKPEIIILFAFNNSQKIFSLVELRHIDFIIFDVITGDNILSMLAELEFNAIKEKGIPFIVICTPEHKAEVMSEISYANDIFFIIRGVDGENLSELFKLNLSFFVKEKKEQRKYKALFHNMTDPLFCLDKHGRIIEFNNAFAQLLGYAPEKLLTLTVDDITPEKWLRFEQVLAETKVKEKGYSEVYEKEYMNSKGEIIPVELKLYWDKSNSNGEGVLWAYVRNISKLKNIFSKFQLNEKRLQALFDLSMMSNAPMQELFDYALKSCIELTQSTIGYIFKFNKEKNSLEMISWQNNSNLPISFDFLPNEFQIDSIGLLGEPVRQRKPIITNDYSSDSASKKGLPSGHPGIDRHLAVPVFYNKEVVATVGVANKPTDYYDNDARNLILLMDGVWKVFMNHKNEQACKESNNKINWFIKLFSGFMFVYDDQGIFVDYLIPNLLDAYAIPENFIGKPYREVLPEYLADLIDKYTDLARQTNAIQEFSYPLQMQEMRYYKARIIKMGNIRFLSVVQDITQLTTLENKYTASQSRLNAVVDTLPQGVVILDEKHFVWQCNDMFTSTLGYSSPEDIIGKSVFDFISTNNIEILRIALNNLLQNPTIFKKDFEFNKNDNSCIALNVTANPAFDKQGNLVSTILIINKIPTLQAQSDEKAQANTERLKESVASKDKFFNIIAHDLKGPISGILSITSFLNDNFRRMTIRELQEISQQINSASDNLYKLLDNLLLWARSQTDKIEFKPELLNLSEVVEKVMVLLMFNAEIKKIQIHSKVSPQQNIFADEQMLLTILRNLLSNAIKFTPEHGEITISSLIEKKENKNSPQFVRISVSDNGMGISQENIEKLFRIDKTFSTLGTQQETGTGLGLILCKEFINRHGGNIWAESQQGKGSTFVFTLPASAFLYNYV